MSDRIRTYIHRDIFQPARKNGITKIIVRAGDIAAALKLTTRYPAICSAMKGEKIEKESGVQILKVEGTDGANFFVTYEF